jgi:hypothetical protein
MKKIIVTIVIGLIFYNCKAQSPILTLDRLGWENTKNAYYKDINNQLDNFEGIWLYTNGNTSFKIKLVKSIKYFNGKYYEDLLVGGYQYIKGGVEKINTLSDANNPSIGRNASIKGNSIHSNCKYLPINHCIEGEKKFRLVHK